MSPGAEDKKPWTVLSLLSWTAAHLQEKGFENSRLNAERLLSHVLALRRVDLYLQFDRPLQPEELSAFKALLKRRIAHEPLQYLLGETEFMSLPFKVEPGVLIPRPETEGLAEKAIEWCSSRFNGERPIRVLDIGTGSGNIAVALAKNVEGAEIIAVDFSPAALALAKENAERHGVLDCIRFELQDIRSASPAEWRQRFDLLVSNPPYIAQREWPALPLEVRDYEPALALQGGMDGFDFYRIFSRRLPDWLLPGGHMLLEIGDGMGDAVSALFPAPAFCDVTIHPDLAGKQRIISANLTGNAYE